MAGTDLTKLISFHELDKERAHIIDDDFAFKLQTRNSRVVSRVSNGSPRHQCGFEDDIVKISI